MQMGWTNETLGWWLLAGCVALVIAWVESRFRTPAEARVIIEFEAVEASPQ